MKFNSIERIILFGGSDTLAECVEIILNKRLNLNLIVIGSQRHLNEKLAIFSGTLRLFLAKRKVQTYSTKDINQFNLNHYVNERTLGLAFGAAWMFDKETVKSFINNHLLDFMVIDLPKYRGGAHYSWMILHGNRNLTLNLQVILGGKQSFQKGPIIKSKSYKIPTRAMIPKDYFNFVLDKEKEFMSEFFDQANGNSSFKLVSINEADSSYYPFLSTKDQGYIDWSWTAEHVNLFIKAFDNPYPGASSFIEKSRFFLKSSRIFEKGTRFHPFGAGIVIRKDNDGIFVCANGGLLNIKKVFDVNGKDVSNQIEIGERFFTPFSLLDNAKKFRAVYDSEGLVKK